MKTKIFIYTTIIAMVLSFSLSAQTRSRLSKVGVVDSTAIFDAISEDESLVEAIEKKFKKDKEQLSNLSEEIKQAKSDISNFEKEENTTQVSKSKNKLKTLEEKHKKLSTTIRSSHTINFEIQRHIAAAIIIITRREGYTAILEKKSKGILYVDKEFDITSKVLVFVRESIKKLG